MSRSFPSPGSKRIPLAFLACCFFSLAALTGPLFAQDPPPQSPPPPANPPVANPESTAKPAQETPARETQEVSTQDTPATFKVRVNNVLVRVVVRDWRGKVVANLKKEDFQLYDGRKLQTITSFAIENPRTHTVPVTTSGPGARSSDADPAAVKAASLPQRFVSMVFDDIHMSMQDAVFVRDSATRFFGSLAPSDRVSMNTTSGQLTQDFTDDHSLLEKALLGIVPRPLLHHDITDCPDISYYQADFIANKHETQDPAVPTEDTVQCAFNGDETMQAAGQSQAHMTGSAVV